MTTADWSVLMVPAVTEKFAETDPAAIFTDPGTERSELLSDKLTVAPPEGAAALRVAVQTEVLPVAREFGLQEIPVSAGEIPPVTEMDPPVAATGNLLPVADTAAVLITPIEADVAEEESFTVNTAITPVENKLRFSPAATQVSELAVPEQATDFAAATVALPGVAVILEMFAAG